MLHYYNNYFGIHYPLPKLDLIGLPDLEAGAMENFGAITYPVRTAHRPEIGIGARPKSCCYRYRTRDGPPVVRRPGNHAVVGQYLAQRGVCHPWMETKAVAHMYPEWDMDQSEASGVDESLDL